ncbi:helix-turn-helix domain-containing protein [Chondromyces crocatus]|uniref:helix-turn-helix domain-containing protein n=1 Tax=Chondromyces crocatus TaxID=52 RepID=UPI0009E8A4EA
MNRTGVRQGYRSRPESSRTPEQHVGDAPDFWTVEEARLYLRLGRKTLYAMIREGTIPGVRHFGRALRLHRPTLIQWAVGAPDPR